MKELIKPNTQEEEREEIEFYGEGHGGGCDMGNESLMMEDDIIF